MSSALLSRKIEPIVGDPDRVRVIEVWDASNAQTPILIFLRVGPDCVFESRVDIDAIKRSFVTECELAPNAVA